MSKTFRYLKFRAFIALSLISASVYAQQHQLAIDRIERMPDLPQPYMMRNWKAVAEGYDAFVFDLVKTGEHLPLIGLKSAGNNYPSLQPILLDTYVGSESANQAEAINILPAIVGASLVGIDKSNQGGINWVEKTKDFFNSKNNQNIYLNGYNATSGKDWWYDLMPNIFFYQLSTLYDDPDYPEQITLVADQWLAAVHAMGGKTTPWTTPNMNYRGWYLSGMTGNSDGVKEPEASGAIAWILYHAYIKTGNKKYLEGAQMSLEFLSSLSSNPSYELQLPYGTLAAAKLNAILGTSYDVNKMLNWCFDRGPLRGWGTITGTWNGKDVSGLVGEANDNGNDYAFLMNGFQQAAALAPVMKYDKRYARAISKWILNLANATRLFYPQFLEASKQDDHTWSSQHDPQSVIGYEALKENWNGQALYGTGDAKRNGWAKTNLALYGSSHAGYLGALIQTTNAEGILRIDVNITDFFGDNRHPVYAYFNPYQTDHNITVQLGEDTYDLYDAISETVIQNDVSNETQFLLKAGEVMMITILPSNAELLRNDRKLYAGSDIIDYHFGYDFTPDFRIKSLSAENSVYEFNEEVMIYASVENASATTSYQWFVNDVLIETTTSATLSWTTPSSEGTYTIRVEAASGDAMSSAEVTLAVVKDIPEAPVILSFQKDQFFYYENDQVKIICHADQALTNKLTYQWEVNGGNFQQQDSLITLSLGTEGLYTVICTATNNAGLSGSGTTNLLIKRKTGPEKEPLAYFPLNVDAKDYSGNDLHAVVAGTQQANDALGLAGFAYRISSSDDIIYLPDNPILDFENGITLSCWISVSPTGREAFVLSHGSWEKRWKISLTPDNRIRWTVKTTQGVKDLDSKEPIQADQFYHITVTYTGYSMELYIDGELDNYGAQQGKMPAADQALTFGQKSTGETQYYLNGIIDEVRIFTEALDPWQVETLKSLWQEVVIAVETEWMDHLIPYPNPVNGNAFILPVSSMHIQSAGIITADGRYQRAEIVSENGLTKIIVSNPVKGLAVLRLRTQYNTKHFKLIFR